MTMASEIPLSAAARVKQIEARCSMEYAAELEVKFRQRQTFPPSVDYVEYASSLSEKDATKVFDAYAKVVDTFDEGVELLQEPLGTPDISRWHLVMEKMMDAIAVVVEQAEDAFLATTGIIGRDHRLLLAKICLTAAQCKDKTLENAAHLAWAKAAVAADPTYFNAYNILGLGYTNGSRFEKALEVTEKANDLLVASGEIPGERAKNLPYRLAFLRKIINSDCKVTRRSLTKDRSITALELWQEMSMERPERHCDFCLWPCDKQCSRCKTAYYCSRDCQRYDHTAHKSVCSIIAS